MEANKAMLIVAEELAFKHGYILVDEFEIDALKDSFWGNVVKGVKAKLAGKSLILKSCKYIFPQFEEDRDEKNRKPRITIDMHFGNPRLNVDMPDGNSCFLTYRDEICTEAQAFGEKGLHLGLLVKDKVDYLIKNQ